MEQKVKMVKAFQYITRNKNIIIDNKFLTIERKMKLEAAKFLKPAKIERLISLQ